MQAHIWELDSKFHLWLLAVVGKSDIDLIEAVQKVWGVGGRSPQPTGLSQMGIISARIEARVYSIMKSHSLLQYCIW